MPKRLIYAEDAIDALADYIHNVNKVMGNGKLSAWDCADAAWSVLGDLPSAQPEIIRCKDCKHYYYADNRIPQEQMCVCDLDGDRWSPDSYCSFAERRTDA